MIISRMPNNRQLLSLSTHSTSYFCGPASSRAVDSLNRFFGHSTFGISRSSFSQFPQVSQFSLHNHKQQTRHYSVYPIGDLAGSINMGLRSQQSHVYAYVQSKTCLSLLDCLYENGFIEYYHFTQGKSFRPVVQVGLKRFMGRDIFHGLQVWSRPGHRRVVSVAKLAHMKKKGLHFLVKTNRGVMTDDQALAYNMGGELLLRVLK